jgi:hypothetical protein
MNTPIEYIIVAVVRSKNSNQLICNDLEAIQVLIADRSADSLEVYELETFAGCSYGNFVRSFTLPEGADDSVSKAAIILSAKWYPAERPRFGILPMGRSPSLMRFLLRNIFT